MAKIYQIPEKIYTTYKTIMNYFSPYMKDYEQVLHSIPEFDDFYNRTLDNFYKEYNKKKPSKENYTDCFGTIDIIDGKPVIRCYGKILSKKRIINEFILNADQYKLFREIEEKFNHYKFIMDKSNIVCNILKIKSSPNEEIVDNGTSIVYRVFEYYCVEKS